MATRSDYQQAVLNWQKRSAQARQVGIPDAAWKPLAQRDLASVWTQGKTPIADREAYDAINAASASLGAPAGARVGDPGKQTGGILDILGNIPSDVHDLVQGFIPGMVGYVTSLPEQVKQDWRLMGMEGGAKQAQTEQQTGVTFGGDWADKLRAAAHMPVFAPLVPGLQTAAAATTPQGRSSLEQHPVSTVLDVGAAVALAGDVGVFGRGAAAADEAKLADYTQAAEAAKSRGELPPPRPKPSILGALQAGQPYKAAGRTGLEAVEKVPLLGAKVNRGTIRQYLMNKTIHPDIVNQLSKPITEEDSANLLRMKQFVRQDLIKEGRALPEEDINQIAEAMNYGDMTVLKDRPDLQTLTEAYRGLQEQAARENPNFVEVPSPWGKSYWYHQDHPVGQAFTAATRADEKAATAVDRAQAARDKYVNHLNKRGGGHDWTKAAYTKLQAADAKATRLQQAADTARSDFHDQFNQYSPAAFHTLLGDKFKAGAIDIATKMFGHDAGKLDEVVNHIRGSEEWKDIEQSIGPEETKQLAADVESTWTTLARDGVDPVYLPNIRANRLSQVMNPSVIPDARYSTPPSWRTASFNLSRSTQNVIVGLTATKRDALQAAAQEHVVNDIVKPLAVDTTQQRFAIQDAIRNGGPTTIDVRDAAQLEMDRNYIGWDPNKFGMGRYFPGNADLFLPKGIEKSMRYMGFTGKDPLGPIHPIFDPAMKVWRFSVLTTPRHISHVVLGGMMMGMMQQGPMFAVDLVRQLRKARALLSEDNPEMRTMLVSKFGGENLHEFTGEQMMQQAAAKSLGRIAGTLRHPLESLKRFEEGTTLMYKVTTMLSREAKGLQRDEAIRIANKWFMDRNSWTPFERATMGKIFPFYGFTRHLFRYLLTYPSDHPLVTSILTNFANQHYNDWNSGLPKDMSFMFFLGAPDENGNVDAVDYRSIDPFRSFYNDFSIAGFSSQLNPALQLAAQEMGVNVLSGTPELYPGSHYNPDTGQMEADRPANLPLKALETLIPETTAVEAKYQLTDQYRNLKVSDPVAFKHRIFTALGIPFAPETINVPSKVQAAQLKRYTDAQNSISAALKSGDFTKAKRYAYVPIPTNLRPYMGNATYATPGQVEYLYNSIRAQADAHGATSASLRSILPKPKRSARTWIGSGYASTPST